MTKHIDPDGWTVTEDRDRPIGSVASTVDGKVAHPIDAYRIMNPEETAGLDDLAVLALWHVAEVDRRLNAVGLPATRTVVGTITVGTIAAAFFDGPRATYTPPPEYPRPVVRRVHTEHGSHAEPPLNPAWDHLTSLRWHAALVEHDGGLGPVLEVHPGHRTVNGIPDRDVFELRYRTGRRGGSAGVRSYYSMWSYLNGIEQGARLRGDTDAASRAEVTW